jgi:hypothetical protein
MIDIIRVRNEKALELDDIATFMDAVFESARDPRAQRRMKEFLPDDRHAIYLARLDNEWKGFAWVAQPEDDEDDIATVLHFYCKGGKFVRDSLVENVVKFAREGGATRLLAWDLNKKPRAFARLFKAAGPVREIIRAYEFDLKEARV